MSRGTFLDISFVLLLLGLPLISFGTVTGSQPMWIMGLVLLTAGFLLPLMLRFFPLEQKPEDEPDVFEEPS
jgi:hypothetical protein